MEGVIRRKTSIRKYEVENVKVLSYFHFLLVMMKKKKPDKINLKNGYVLAYSSGS